MKAFWEIRAPQTAPRAPRRAVHRAELPELQAKAARKNAIFALVTGKPGKFTYAQMEGPECNQASGIIEFYSPAYMEILRSCEAMGKVELVPLDGTPLETLLERYGFTQVDWISVDCEGCKPSFISGFDSVGRAGGVKARKEEDNPTSGG
jgi:hypothetical protein